MDATKKAMGEAVSNAVKHNDWWNRGVEVLIQEKKKAYNRWLITKDSEDRKYK